MTHPPGIEMTVVDVIDETHDARSFVVRPGFDGPNPYGARSNREARADEDQLPVYRVLATRT